MSNLDLSCAEICDLAPVIPVLTVTDSSKAVALGKALVDGGLLALEITLRTETALESIREMSQIQGAVVGAGTLLTAEDVKAAKAAGACFGVSPGSTDSLLEAAEEIGLPMLPGVASASEAMKMLARGYNVLKFFPAEAAGGVAMLKALGAPLSQISFCPTGGVSPDNARDYLALSNVRCVGDSWVAPKDLVDGGRWAEITALAAQSANLPR